MTVLQIEQKSGQVIVQRGGGGGRTEKYPSALIHGCKTSIPARGKITVYDVQSTWADNNGRLHISGDRNASGSNDGFGVSL